MPSACLKAVLCYAIALQDPAALQLGTPVSPPHCWPSATRMVGVGKAVPVASVPYAVAGMLGALGTTDVPCAPAPAQHQQVYRITTGVGGCAGMSGMRVAQQVSAWHSTRALC